MEETFYIFYKGSRVFIEWESPPPPLTSNGIQRICSVTPQYFLLLLNDNSLYEAIFDQSHLRIRLSLSCICECVDVACCRGSVYLVLRNGSVLTQRLNDGKNVVSNGWQTVTFDPLELAEEGVCIKRVCCSTDGTIFVSDTYDIYALGNCGSHFSVDCYQPKLVRLFKNSMEVADVSAGDNFFVFLARRKKQTDHVSTAVRECVELPDLVCSDTQHRKNEPELSSSVNSENLESNIQHLVQLGQSLLHTEVYTIGSLNRGLLGTGDHIKRDSVVTVEKLRDIGICSIATGRDHTVVRTVDGSFYHWGLNDHQQLTTRSHDVYEMSSPTEFTFNSSDPSALSMDILEACCGDYRTVLLNTQGDIFEGDKQVMHKEKDFVTLQMRDNSQQLYPLLLASADLTIYNRRLFKGTFCLLLHHLQNQIKNMIRYRKNCIHLKKIVDLQQICHHWENVMYLGMAILNSLEQLYRGDYDNPSQLLIVAYFRECVHIYETYSKCYCDIYSIDGFGVYITHTICDSTNEDIVKIFKYPFQIFPHITQLLEQVQKSGCNFKDELSAWLEFIRRNRIDMELAENTRDFWLSNQKNSKITHFKRRERRVILSSTSVPIKISHSMIGLTTPVFILFSDYLCQVVNHVTTFPLDAMWLKRDNCGITIKTPEKKFTLVARNQLDNDLWYDQLESSIKRILNLSDKSRIPEVRYINYNFSNHSNNYSGVYVKGSFSNAVMHGKCSLQFPNGKMYAGDIIHGVIEGYGRMYLPKVGLYKGYFKSGKFSGHGTLIISSKEIYEGNFRNGLFNGHGHLQLPESIYVGEFEDNLKSGYGVLDSLVTGEKYLGMFADNKRMGQGICITASGNYFEANFANDVLTGKSVAIFPNRYYYEGECSLNGPNGTGKYYMAKGEKEQSSIDNNMTANWENTITGNVLIGQLSGTWENVRINSGSMEIDAKFTKYPSSLGSYGVNNSRKWCTLFNDFEYEIFDDLANATSNSSKALTFALWNRVVSFINKQQEIDNEKIDELEIMNTSILSTAKSARRDLSIAATSDVDKLSLNSSLFGCEQIELNKSHSQSDDMLHSGFESYNLDLLSSFSSKLKNLNNEDQANITSTFPTLMAVMENSAASFNDSAISNSDTLEECLSLQREMELIPPFGFSDLNEQDLYDIKTYLKDAFRYRYHPLKHLNDRIAHAFYRSYGCWKIKPSPLLAKQAMREWESISQRMYKCIRRLFPALPEEIEDIVGEQKEVVSHVTLLYPIVLTESIYSTLFVLYASIYSHKDELYRQNLIKAEKLTDTDLLNCLEFGNELLDVIRTTHFSEAIRMLNELKEKYSPMAMLTVIENCMEKLSHAYQEISRGKQTSLNADVIMPLTLILLLRTGIHHLGAELALLDDLTDGKNFQFEMNGIRGYCLTTLKASYEHLANKSLFENN